MKITRFLILLGILSISQIGKSQNENQSTMNKEIQSKTVVFIHGLFMNNHSWDGWVEFFEAAGYICYAPAHPGHAGIPTELRQKPPKDLAKVEFVDWLNKLKALIDTLPEKPILIGHSFGGLSAQKLVESGYAEAAILISSAPPKGVRSLNWGFLRANLPVVAPWKGESIYNPEESDYKKWFHRSITNTLEPELADSLFEAFAVPESRATPRAATKEIASIDTQKAHVPLLFIAGLEDVIIPNVLVRKNVALYSDESSIVDFKYFPGKDHFICGAPGWQQIAEYCLQWIQQ